MPREQPVFIYRGSKHRNSWLVQKVASVADWLCVLLAVRFGLAVALCCSSGIINTDSHLYQSQRNSNHVNPPLGSAAYSMGVFATAP